jgi:predicted CopG family antitoxin
MPVPGYKNITITKEVYQKIEILAKLDNRSVSNEAEHLIINADRNRKRAAKRSMPPMEGA